MFYKILTDDWSVQIKHALLGFTPFAVPVSWLVHGDLFRSLFFGKEVCHDLWGLFFSHPLLHAQTVSVGPSVWTVNISMHWPPTVKSLTGVEAQCRRHLKGQRSNSMPTRHNMELLRYWSLECTNVRDIPVYYPCASHSIERHWIWTLWVLNYYHCLICQNSCIVDDRFIDGQEPF